MRLGELKSMIEDIEQEHGEGADDLPIQDSCASDVGVEIELYLRERLGEKVIVVNVD